MGAEGPVRSDAAVATRELIDDAVPEASVDEEAMDENDGLALAGFAVADTAGGKVDLVTLV
jgi:hypothetical protein